MTRPLPRMLAIAARPAGVALGIALVALGRLRGDRALHAHGDQWDGVLRVEPPKAETGSPLMDQPGEHVAIVRRSRALSWPLPRDISGLALRVDPASDRPVDLLLAGTWTSAVGRWILRPDGLGPRGPLTTLLPLCAPHRRLWFRADAIGVRRWRLSVSSGRSGWEPWAVLEARRPHPGVLRFDPIGRPPPGLTWPRWVALLRDPAYRWSRRRVAARPPADDRVTAAGTPTPAAR